MTTALLPLGEARGSKALLPGATTCEGEVGLGPGPGTALLVMTPRDTFQSLPVVERHCRIYTQGPTNPPPNMPWGKERWRGFPSQGASRDSALGFHGTDATHYSPGVCSSLCCQLAPSPSAPLALKVWSLCHLHRTPLVCWFKSDSCPRL